MPDPTRFGVVLLCALMTAAAQAAIPSPGAKAGFQPNLGQSDERVAFWAEGNGIDLFVTTKGELVHLLRGSGDQDWVLIERLESSQALNSAAAALTETQITWMDDEDRQSAFTASEIDLGSPWPGIRADVQLREGQFEKRFHLQPGADASAIGVALDGVDAMHIDADGRLVLKTGLGDVELSAPIAWQEIDGRREPVDVAYALTGENRYGFSLGPYDPGHSLTIDPIIRSTFVGGTAGDGLAKMQVTADSVYVSGNAGDPNFPGMTGGFQSSLNRNTVFGSNIYIARYSLDLSTLMQATYFGAYGPFGQGGQSDGAQIKALVVTADGVFITGPVPGTPPMGSPAHIPTTAGALQTAAISAQYGAFVARLSLDLTQLLAATYYSGTTQTTSWPMVVSDTGVFIAGESATTNLPGLVNGANNAAPLPAGTGAAFVAKLSLDLSTAIAASWISGGGWDMYPRAMTLGPDGSVYVGGYGSRGLFQTTGAAQPNRIATNFTSDGFIVRLNSDLSVIHRSTYLGSTGADRVESLAFGNGKLYAGGGAGAANFPVPVGGAVTTWLSGASYIAVLAADLSTIDGGSFFRGDIYAGVSDIEVNNGTVYLAGSTTSTTLPGITGAAEPTSPGGFCGYLASFNSTLTQIQQSTFVNCGSGITYISDTDFLNDTLYIAGTTRRTSLPGIAGAQPTSASSDDGYILTATADLAGPKPNADIAVTKTGSVLREGKYFVRYKVSVRNIGPDAATEVLIEDTLPAEVSAATWQCAGLTGASCPQASGSGSISVTAALPVGGKLEYEICGYVGLSNSVSNTATASVPSHTLDPVGSNNSATVIMTDPRLFADGFEDPTLPPWCPSI